MFGYTEAEALGRSLDLITPERLRTRHWEGYNKSMATGTTRYGNDLLRVPATHKDGRAMSIAFTVAMLFTPDHKVDAVVAIIRDETTRFNDDRALRKRLAEAEAKLAALAQ
jgi:PAS domain S-box-containing protein